MRPLRRRHFRFVGGFHDGVRTPFWCWQGEALERKEVKLPIARPRVMVHQPSDPLVGSGPPEAEEYALRDLEFNGSDLRVEMWVAKGTTSDQALKSTIETLLDGDSPT